jgi:hypothetical protein
MGQVGGMFSHNLFAYCGNSPVIRYDPTGQLFDFANVIKNIVRTIKITMVKLRALSRLKKNLYTNNKDKRKNVAGDPLDDGTYNEFGHSDCSSFVFWCYKAINVSIGTTTTDQLANKSLTRIHTVLDNDNYPDEDFWAAIIPGDLVYFSKYPGSGKDVGHVEMYLGDGRFIGHGSGWGPTIKTNLYDYIDTRLNNPEGPYGGYYCVLRVITIPSDFR